jgi:SAM-dependent methyltransferase
MQFSTAVHSGIKKLLGPQLTGYVRRCLYRRVPEADSYLSPLVGKRALEIGGPTSMFCEGGSLPVYGMLGSVDNCLFANQTIWEGRVQEGRNYHYHWRKQPGLQFICEATDLKMIQDSSYDCVLAANCLEHIANPLKALAEWKRVLKEEGLLLLVLPHKVGTFDWRRSTTSIDHMIDDYERGVGEDDMTHLAEILALHDLKKDKPAGSAAQFRERCLKNYSNRALHHHVFETRTALAMVDRAAYQVIKVDVQKPYDIIILARECTGTPDNAQFLGAQAEYLRRTPFPSDRSYFERHEE